MSESEFRIGDTVTMSGEIVWQSQDGGKVRVWIRRDDGTYTVCPIAGLKAV